MHHRESELWRFRALLNSFPAYTLDFMFSKKTRNRESRKNKPQYPSSSFFYFIRTLVSQVRSLLKLIDTSNDFTSPFTTQFLFRSRRYIKHERQCFIGYPNSSNFVKNTPPLVKFSILFWAFESSSDTLSLAFYMLRPHVSGYF